MNSIPCKVLSKLKQSLSRSLDIYNIRAHSEKRFLRFHSRPALTKLSDRINDQASLNRVAEDLRAYLKKAETIPHLDQKFKQYIQRIMEHEFDILGSGWRKCRYGNCCENNHPSNGDPARAIREKMALVLRKAAEKEESLTEADKTILQNICEYEPINWHMDLKSSHSWMPPVKAKAMRPGSIKGADIKAPAEISRFQHGVSLGIAFVQCLPSKKKSSGSGQNFFDLELILQLLDWIVSNPPYKTVGWLTSLVTGIRCANWIWAISLIKESPYLTLSMNKIFYRSLNEHAAYLMKKLKKKPRYTNNHYLGAILGLMHFAYSFPSMKSANELLIFCIQELINEMRVTVYKDGGSYESSLYYHRFVTEMFLHGTSLALKLEKERRNKLSTYLQQGNLSRSLPPIKKIEFNIIHKDIFPPWYYERLYDMCLFSANFVSPSSLTPILGDNDNGRFIKFGFINNANSGDLIPDEEFRNHRHLLCSAGRLFQDDNLKKLGKSFHLDACALFSNPPNLSNMKKIKEQHTKGNLLTNEEGYKFFPNSGLAVYRRSRIWMMVACGKAGRGGLGGHGHNDILSFELYIDGVPVIIDPGMYTYSADIDIRNLMRSSRVHNTVWIKGHEQQEMMPGREGIFRLYEKANAVIDEVNSSSFSGHHTGYGSIHRRHFKIREDSVQIDDDFACEDGCGNIGLTFSLKATVEEREKEFYVSYRKRKLLTISFSGIDASLGDGQYSRKYGVIEKVPQIIGKRTEQKTHIEFSLR